MGHTKSQFAETLISTSFGIIASFIFVLVFFLSREVGEISRHFEIFEDIKEEWERGAIIDLKFNEDACPEGYDTATGWFYGTNRLIVQDDEYEVHSNQITKIGEIIEAIRPFEIGQFNGGFLCIKRAPYNFFNIIEW